MKTKKNTYIFLIIIFLFTTVLFWYAQTKIELYGTKEQEELQKSNQIREYQNVWILSWKAGELLFFADGEINYLEAVTEEEYCDVIADLKIKDGKLISIVLKPDTIRGKVVSVGESTIEIEGYGKLPLSENFRVYRNYGEIGEGTKYEIIVGYDVQDFFVGNGMVCAALVEQKLQISDIRVLLLGTESEKYQKQIILTAQEKLIIEDTEGNECYQAKSGTNVWFYQAEDSRQKIWLEQEDGTILENEIAEGKTYQIRTENGGKIMVCSIEKLQGNPSYRGILEVELTKEGYLLRNEVSVEEYLYAVVPSEMPASYAKEALKAQAVCARSYAYRNIEANSLYAYGAHVDDSTAYQVYNNLAEQRSSTNAVDETRGQVLICDGKVAQTYYFSTSCGATTNTAVWSGGTNLSYLAGRLVTQENGTQEQKFVNAGNLQAEEVFRTFIQSSCGEDFDSEFAWYRWSICFSQEDIIKCLQAKGLYEAVGTPMEMQITRRNTGGVAEELQIIGTNGTAVLEKEYAIRSFLSPKGRNLYDKNKTVNTTFSILPSAYFIIDTIKDEEKSTFSLSGGGFGHGVGMSQNAAKKMAEVGYDYVGILKFFYEGAEVAVY